MAEAETVSVLMLDIQGSTRLHEKIDDAGYLFSLIPTFHKFIDRKIAERIQDETNREGLGEFQKQLQAGDDCVKAVFATAQNAVACAVDIQNQFKQFPVATDKEGKEIFLTLHLSIHLCETLPEDGSPRRSQISPLARLLKKANNGQILLSPACYDAYVNEYAVLHKQIPFPCELYGGYLFDGISGEQSIYSLQYDNKYRGAPGVQFLGFENLEAANQYIKREKAEALVRDTFEKAIGERYGKIRLVTVCGEGGMGKTRLTINCARQMVGRFPGGVIFVPLADFNETKPTPEGVATRISDALHFVKTPGVDSKRELLLRLQEREEPTLLLLDNAETVTPHTETLDYLQELLQEAPFLYFLASSRTWFELDTEGQVDINDGLTPWESFRLFQERARAGFALPEAVSEEEIKALDLRMQRGTEYTPPKEAPTSGREHNLFCLLRLFWLANHNSLALELIASWTDKYKVIDQLLASYQSDALSWFTRHGGRPSGNKTTRDRHVSLEASYHWSWKNLGEEGNGSDAQAAFIAAALFADPFTDEAIEAVLGWNNAGRTAAAAKAVQNASLFRSFATPTQTRYRMHWQLQKFGRDEKYWQTPSARYSNVFVRYFQSRAKRVTTHSELRRNFVAYYVNSMGQYGQRQVFNSALRRTWLGDEWGNVVVAVHYAVQEKSLIEGVNLCLGLSNYLRLTSKWRVWEDTVSEVYLSVLQKGYKFGQAALRHEIGVIYKLQNRYDEAEIALLEALAISQSLRLWSGQAQTLNALGNVYRAQRRWEEAEKMHKEALIITKRIGDKYEHGVSLNNLGVDYTEQSRWKEAEDIYTEALILFKGLGELYGQGATLSNIAHILREQKRWREAEETYLKSNAIFTEMNNVSERGKALQNLATLSVTQGDFAKATDYAYKGIAVVRQTEDTVRLQQLQEILDQCTAQASTS